jgi:hypothetical protein
MPSVFCCQCGDGPHSKTYVVNCTSCNHRLCTLCPAATEYYNYRHTTPTPAQHHRTATVPGQSSTTRPSGTHQHASTARSVNSPPTGRGNHYEQRPQRPQRPHRPVWRWQCCLCLGNNSVKADPACAICSNHWRGRCCKVWDDTRGES